MSFKFFLKDLDRILSKFVNQNIYNIELEFLISMEKDYYSGEMFKEVCRYLKTQILNNKNYIIFNQKKFKVEKIRLKICDTLNRHNLYYRYCATYMTKFMIDKEVDIPENIRLKFEKMAYQDGQQQGEDWVRANIESINQLIPQPYKLDKRLQIKNEKTLLYEGDINNPKIELIRYTASLNNSKYKKVAKSLKSICDLKDSVISRSINYETKYFLTRLENRGEHIKYENFFNKQSFKYLFDEIISFIINHQEQNNLIEIYVGGGEPKPTLTFRGRKAQNNPEIKKLMEKGQPLEGADQRKFVSVKLIEEDKKGTV